MEIALARIAAATSTIRRAIGPFSIERSRRKYFYLPDQALT